MRYKLQCHSELFPSSIELIDLICDLQQSDFDQLLVNLRMDAVFVKENMRIMWVSEAGMVENIDQIIKEYKDSRKLQVKNTIKIHPTVCLSKETLFIYITCIIGNSIYINIPNKYFSL